MRTNYVLIDYENVQPEDLSLLRADHFRIFVFVGANQKKLRVGIVKTLQPFGERAEYIQIAGTGPNALDFHIAFYIGQLAEKDSASYFHIISADKGFDPLTQHLKEQKGILAKRYPAIEDIPLLWANKTPAERREIVIAHLKQLKSAPPRKLDKLSNLMLSIFHKQLSAGEIETIQRDLAKDGIVSINGTKVTYNLPD